MKKIYTSLLIVLLISICNNFLAQTKAFKQNQKLGRGINLGNALEAPNEGEWGVTLQASYFEMIADKGYHSVRIPIRWSNHALTIAPYTIDATFFARIDWAIQNALKNKLMVIINCHHYDEIFQDPAAHKPRLLGIWGQISRRYANYSDSVIFEPLNEPNTNLTAELWNSYFSETLDTIRKSNITRTCLVGIAEWGGIGGLSKLVLPNDTNLILTVHYYNPFQFTHQGASWVTGSNDWLGTGWYNTEAERNTIIGEFQAIKTFSTNHNIPVHVGEFGAFSGAEMESRIRWTNYCARYFEVEGFSWAYWEFCSGFGIYNTSNSTWNQGLVDAMQTMPMPEPYVDPTGNLLFNGDFGYGITKWTKYTNSPAVATFGVTGQKGVVTITNGGTADWHVQLYNAGLIMEYNKKYHLEFDAYASASRNINVSIGKSSSPYTTYFSTTTSLTSTSNKFTYEFTMNQATDSASRLLFNLGNSTGTIYLDNILLREGWGTGIELAESGSGLKIYPIPARNYFTIEFSDIQQVLLFNTIGQKVADIPDVRQDRLTIDCSTIPRGIYILRITNKLGITRSTVITLE